MHDNRWYVDQNHVVRHPNNSISHKMADRPSALGLVEHLNRLDDTLAYKDQRAEDNRITLMKSIDEYRGKLADHETQVSQYQEQITTLQDQLKEEQHKNELLTSRLNSRIKTLDELDNDIDTLMHEIGNVDELTLEKAITALENFLDKHGE